jgi:heat shock protein HtpX
VELFEERVRQNTLYFAWREGEEIVPEEFHKGEKKSINRLFIETQILLFVTFIVVGVVLFLFVNILIVPVLLLAIQFVIVFYSNKIVARVADWHITESSPFIHLLEYHLPLGKNGEIRKRFSKDKVTELKKEVYDQIISKKGEIDCEAAQQIFVKYGFECSPDNFTTKKVNVYDLVKRTADKFHFPMPEIVVSNTVAPNAAASGPSPSRGVVLITTGLLEQLEDDEILSVLGHEFGHLKGRDPLVLYGLTGAEFLFRFYVLLQLFPFIFLSYLFIPYFWAVMVVIFFIAKFFEARADLVSAIVFGQPKVLAEALEKIGFKRLLYERAPSYRFQEWINWDPHPPIYFRVNRLEKLKVPVDVRHPLVQSAKDVINGFRASF